MKLKFKDYINVDYDIPKEGSIDDIVNWVEYAKKNGATCVGYYICDEDVTLYAYSIYEETDEAYNKRIWEAEDSRDRILEKAERAEYERLKRKYEL